MRDEHYGPWSVVAAVVGILAVTTPWTLAADPWWVPIFATPLLGLALVLVPGRVRHVGLGLFASFWFLPAFLLTWPLALALLGS